MFFGRDDKRDAGKRPALLPLLPLRDIVVFPHQVLPLFVGRERSIAALHAAMERKSADETQKALIFLAAQKKAKTNEPGADDVYHFGTVGHVIQLLPLPDGTVKVLVEGMRRGRIRRFVDTGPYFTAEVDELEEIWQRSVELEALVRSVHSVFEAFVKLNKRIPPEMLVQVASIDDPARLADTIAVQLSLKLNDRQALLEMDDAAKRLEKLYELMQGEIEILQVEK
ncbi:MAG TPA: LON peptidase substrate-binding domain-containing protein, partial [Myxococcaceae bacterium]|nr:LON peptidase substrate-binding domain-containing protein [Myxococcaceae bacterium]